MKTRAGLVELLLVVSLSAVEFINNEYDCLCCLSGARRVVGRSCLALSSGGELSLLLVRRSSGFHHTSYLFEATKSKYNAKSQFGRLCTKSYVLRIVQ